MSPRGRQPAVLLIAAAATVGVVAIVGGAHSAGAQSLSASPPPTTTGPENSNIPEADRAFCTTFTECPVSSTSAGDTRYCDKNKTGMNDALGCNENTCCNLTTCHRHKCPFGEKNTDGSVNKYSGGLHAENICSLKANDYEQCTNDVCCGDDAKGVVTPITCLSAKFDCSQTADKHATSYEHVCSPLGDESVPCTEEICCHAEQVTTNDMMLCGKDFDCGSAKLFPFNECGPSKVRDQDMKCNTGLCCGVDMNSCEKTHVCTAVELTISKTASCAGLTKEKCNDDLCCDKVTLVKTDDGSASSMTALSASTLLSMALLTVFGVVRA